MELTIHIPDETAALLESRGVEIAAFLEEALAREAQAASHPPAEPSLRKLSESLRLAREHASTATLDGNFAADLEAAIQSHPEPLSPPEWD
jgi:hypothetical protein